MSKLTEMEVGDCIEDMDMFHTALMLYVRCKGVPCIRVLPLGKGEKLKSIKCVRAKGLPLLH